MIFAPELAAKVLAGEKVVTRRLVKDNPRSPWWSKRCAFKPGQVFAVQPGRAKHAIGRAKVLNVRRQHLGRLEHAEARREGFEGRAAFEKAWARINGGYDPDAVVWRVEFLLLASVEESAAA